MTNYEKHDMFILMTKANGNEIKTSEVEQQGSNEKKLKPASFTNVAAMLGGF